MKAGGFKPHPHNLLMLIKEGCKFAPFFIVPTEKMFLVTILL
jgi:hypothetical protein